MTTDCLVSNNMVIVEDDDDDVSSKPTPVNIDVSLAVEKEMTIALTGKPARSGKIIQRVSDQLSLVSHHGDDRLETVLHHKCEECQKTFISSAQFKLHSYEVHKITHPFRCTVCEKSFSSEPNLKVHLRTHNNEKPYRCDQCGRSFTHCGTWMQHMVRHSGATPYICEECGKAFATKGDLATHTRIHRPNKPFQCEECGKSFPRKSNYTRHMRKHTGEKPYKCQFCQKAFSRMENCKEHENLHRKEKPYVCDLCGASFSNSGNFSKHKRQHLKDNNKSLLNNKLKAIKELEDDEDVHLQIDTDISDILPSNGTKKEDKMNDKKPRKSKIRTICDTLEKKPEDQNNELKLPELIPSVAIQEQAQPLTLNILRQPIILAKPMPVTLDNVVVPLSEASETKTNFPQTCFIKLSGDNFLSVNQQQQQLKLYQGHQQPLLEESEQLKLPSYQFHTYNNSATLNPQQQVATNALLTDFSFSSSAANFGMNSNNQTFMMLDHYQRDSTFSFNQDGSLVIQNTNFQQPPHLTGADNFIYDPSFMMDNNLVTDPASSTQTIAATDILCNPNFNIEDNSVSPIFLSDYDGAVDGKEPLDTNKFLNEQYLIKKPATSEALETAESSNENNSPSTMDVQFS